MAQGDCVSGIEDRVTLCPATMGQMGREPQNVDLGGGALGVLELTSEDVLQRFQLRPPLPPMPWWCFR